MNHEASVWLDIRKGSQPVFIISAQLLTLILRGNPGY
jgi:hypothetical protein